MRAISLPSQFFPRIFFVFYNEKLFYFLKAKVMTIAGSIRRYLVGIYRYLSILIYFRGHIKDILC